MFYLLSLIISGTTNSFGNTFDAAPQSNNFGGASSGLYSNNSAGNWDSGSSFPASTNYSNNSNGGSFSADNWGAPG